MPKTYTEQLDEVQAAISELLTGGQSFQIRDRTYTRADLRVLQEREKYLIGMVSREMRGNRGARVRYGVPS